MSPISEFPQRGRVGYGSSLKTDTTTAAYPADKERRRPPLRCAGCNSWNRAGLVFMSNGADYCIACAKSLAERLGYSFKPAGRRWGDILAFD